ncbi:phosphatidylethanolamine-binding protein [Nostoc minutum NIES-26]|uniref:Phosphatidylethanolamine-binding protein n=1 Tax=Nostoc minutum NIES-26 TaxID=1844469 RepID=A0A367QWB0_9NOSO|nr:YbhB/YbcL family Raf kinase inhibitor-like protein [Dendronalium sp. ChiSLP03b]MDZ8207106.1 YbhB/YbcL family Raf kinase inhibitor-like protein [Dendronalium sp. ChiSLP03b]RCJ28497.1 phosphatidylethanolamine-binding protein [Nostoc minutum NIES-26]
MKLESSVFDNNGLIPAKYTCDGADISPPLIWHEVPTGTQSIVLIVDDPDAPGRTFVHWVVYDIPATVSQLPERIPSVKTLPNGGVQGTNDFGKLGYGGPCPPSGTHRYFFKLYALDQKLALAAGATKNQILAAMESYVLAKADLIGLYKRQR